MGLVKFHTITWRILSLHNLRLISILEVLAPALLKRSKRVLNIDEINGYDWRIMQRYILRIFLSLALANDLINLF